MSNHDLDWLAAQRPRQTEPDGAARERALQALIGHTSRPGKPGFRIGGVARVRIVGLTAASVAAAVVAGVVLSGGTGSAGSGGAVARHAVRVQAPVDHGHLVKSPLARLADYVVGSGTPAGNATVVTRTTTSDGNSVTVYDLYADSGQYFFSRTEGGLTGEVSAHHNLAGGLFSREVAAAKSAATGDVQQAAQAMADAPNPGHVISPTETINRAAAAKKGVKDPGNLYDNWVWEDSQDAIIAGSGQPDVRAGVLRILATLPGVVVTHGTSAGQPTLVLTAGTPELGSGYAEQLTINAETGVPIQLVGGPPGGTPAATVDYKVSRVTLGDLPSDPAGTA